MTVASDTGDERRDAGQVGGDEGRRILFEEARRRLRGRNLALLGVLVGLVVLFYLLTFVILGNQ